MCLIRPLLVREFLQGCLWCFCALLLPGSFDACGCPPGYLNAECLWTTVQRFRSTRTNVVLVGGDFQVPATLHLLTMTSKGCRLKVTFALPKLRRNEGERTGPRKLQQRVMESEKYWIKHISCLEGGVRAASPREERSRPRGVLYHLPVYLPIDP